MIIILIITMAINAKFYTSQILTSNQNYQHAHDPGPSFLCMSEVRRGLALYPGCGLHLVLTFHELNVSHLLL